MKTKLLVVAALAAVLPSCQGGPDLMRYQTEVANLQFARRCAHGWFTHAQFTALDEAAVLQALEDWRSRLASDAQLLGVEGPAR